MLASKPAWTLNQIIPDLGIPIPSKRAVLELCGLDERVHQGRPFRPAL